MEPNEKGQRKTSADVKGSFRKRGKRTEAQSIDNKREIFLLFLSSHIYMYIMSSRNKLQLTQRRREIKYKALS